MPFRTIPIRRGSTNISTVNYNDDTKELKVRFVRGAQYLYKEVEGDVADGFTQADSAGRYFRSAILNQYEYTQIL